MATRSPIERLVSALDRLGGVRPNVADCALLEPRLSDRVFRSPLAQLWPEIRGPVEAFLSADSLPVEPLESAPGGLDEIDPADAETLLAFLQIQTLAYSSRWGEPRRARRQARSITASMGRVRSWCNSRLFDWIDPYTLRLPRDGYSYGCSPVFSDATFEETVLLVSPRHVALLMWTDED